MVFFSDLFHNIMTRQMEKRFASGEYKAPPKGDPIVADEAARLNFIVWGDCQVSNYMFARECCFRQALLDVEGMKGKLDALVICGDIAENGLKSEYRVTAELLNSVSSKFDRFIGMPGNHDVRFRRYKTQLRRFVGFLKSVEGAAVPSEGHYYYSTEINGFRFIVMGTDRSTFEAAFISDAQLKWLDRELASAQGTGRPVFVFNHQTLRRLNGLPYTWLGKGSWRGDVGRQSDKVRAIFEKYDNVIFITGHLHFGTSRFSFEDPGRFGSLSVQTVGAGNHGECSYDAQGYVISVYDDRIVMRARSHSLGRYVEKSVPNAEVVIPLKKNDGEA